MVKTAQEHKHHSVMLLLVPGANTFRGLCGDLGSTPRAAVPRTAPTEGANASPVRQSLQHEPSAAPFWRSYLESRSSFKELVPENLQGTRML